MSSLASHVAHRTDSSPRFSRAPDVDDLTALGEVARALAESSDLKQALSGALKRLAARTHPGIAGAVILIVGDGLPSGEIRVAESPTASWRQGSGVRSHLRRAMDTLRPVVVPRPPGEGVPGELSRVPAPDRTLVAVPVLLDGAAVGAVGIEYVPGVDRDITTSIAWTDLLADMVGHAVAASRRLEREKQRTDEGADAQAPGQPALSKLVGTSDPLGQVRALVAQVAQSNTTVMLRGESGTGKGLIAHAIHLNSPRAKRPFVTVSCAALPIDLIESELFGYEKGAFTGADALKKGRLELANGGTLFLDEVGELPPAVQVKLLRVLQEREFERLGGSHTIPLDVRVLAATNRNLDKAVAAGAFREDLYYRLNVFPIFVPPLRERKADVLLLADHFLEKFAREQGKTVARISTPAIDMLMSYHWPGNVRELSNAIERAVVICEGGVLHSHHLPPTLQTAESSGTASNLSLKEMVEAVEKDALQDALKSARGNRATAARLLRTTRRILNYKLKNYGIDARRFQE
jgi:Nif-specific regulatory protein